MDVQAGTAAHEKPPSPLNENVGYFTENVGQWPNSSLRYVGSSGPFRIALAEDAILLVATAPGSAADSFPEAGNPFGARLAPAAPVGGVLLRVTFAGSHPRGLAGRAELPFRSNFLLGNDPAGWRTGVRNYGEVIYSDLYEGIDLRVAASPNGLKYAFVLRPGAAVQRIIVTYEGADRLEIAPSGDLRIETAVGAIEDAAPSSVTEAGTPVPCRFVLRNGRSHGYACDGWDGSEALTIDPLLFSTILGTSFEDVAYGVAIDASGASYVTGYTWATDFPTTPGAFQFFLAGNSDAFVTKIRADGGGLVYSTYLGGASHDPGFSIQVNASGYAFVAGGTNSPDFPTTPNGFDRTINDGTSTANDGYLAVLSPGGDALVYGTFIGGPEYDDLKYEALDASGGVYLVGYTYSSLFPTTPGAWDTSFNGVTDGFVLKVDPAGALAYATFLGGSSDDHILGVTVNSVGDAYVAGATWSGDFPTTASAYDRAFGGNLDIFVTKLDPSGAALVFSTFLGGSGLDGATSIVVDAADNAYIAGLSDSLDFPITGGALQPYSAGGADVVVAKLSSDGRALLASTYLGGASEDRADSLAIDVRGDVYVTGYTRGRFPVTPCSFDSNPNGGVDAFVTALNLSGGALIYSTLLGGAGVDRGWSIAADSSRHAYVAGYTDSPDFPTTPGAWDPSADGMLDGFLSKFDVTPPTCQPDLAVAPSDIVFTPPGPVANGTQLTVQATIHNDGNLYATALAVRFFDGLPPASNRIDGDQVLPFLAAGGADNVSAPWVASPPGLHTICVFADPDNVIAESNETNNMACTPVSVLGPPDYAPTGPRPASPARGGLSLPIALSIRVVNLGDAAPNATATVAFFNASTPGTPFATSLVGPVPPGATAGPFVASWPSPATSGVYFVAASVDWRDDIAESNESNNVYTWTILVVPGPVTSLVVGAPSVIGGATYVTSATPLSFSVLDQSGTGIRNTTYRVDGGAWINFTATGSFTLTGDGSHVLEWSSEDNVGNVESVRSSTLRVDNTAPTTTLSIGDPKYLVGGAFVTSGTPLTLAAADGGATPVGLRATEYRIDGGAWVGYSIPFSLAVEGSHTIDYRSDDALGNAEALRTLLLVVDNTPPVTTPSPKDGTYPPGTAFTFTATDEGAGVARTEVRLDGGSWTTYASPLELAEGPHSIGFRSVDHLNNTEAERVLTITIRSTPPPPPAAANLKPLVAAVFAAILAAAGAWSSRRRPWKDASGRRAIARAFAFTSIPFVLAEAVTGVVSMVTGLLSIPPILGAGMIVDLAILVAGLAVAAIRIRRRRGQTVNSP